MSHKATIRFSRFALALVYVWFGVLKIFGTSPANPLIENVLHKTLPFVTFDHFIIFLGIFEAAIGILFISGKFPKTALTLIIIHLITTTGPLVLLPSVTWQGILIPTLEGQYIIKNILILAIALFVTFGSRKNQLRMPLD